MLNYLSHPLPIEGCGFLYTMVSGRGQYVRCVESTELTNYKYKQSQEDPRPSDHIAERVLIYSTVTALVWLFVRAIRLGRLPLLLAVSAMKTNAQTGSGDEVIM